MIDTMILEHLRYIMIKVDKISNDIEALQTAMARSSNTQPANADHQQADDKESNDHTS